MLRRRKPSGGPVQGAPNGEATAAFVKSRASGGWGRRVAICVVIALLIATGVVFWQEQGQSRKLRDTAIARRAAESRPEVAELLREVNELACQLIEKYPYSPDAVDVMARLHHLFGETEEALRFWNQCLEIDPNFTPAYRSIGVMFLEIGKHQEAAEYFRQGHEQDPASTLLSVELAQALVAVGRHEEAIEVLLQDVKLHPRSVATLAMLGHAYLEQREYAKARTFFERAIKVGPKYTNAYFGLVTACRNLGDREAVEKYADILKERKAQDEQLHRTVLKTYDDLERVRGQASAVHMAAGNVYLVHSDPISAESCFLRATELAPDSVPAYEVLSWLYVQQGRTDEAIRMLGQLTSADSDSLAAVMTGGMLYTQLRRYEDAEQCYQRAIELTPHMAGGYAALARLYLEAGIKPQEALKLAEKAVQLEPLAKYHFLLGNVYQAHGRITDARQEVATAVKLDPANVEYRNVLELFGSPD